MISFVISGIHVLLLIATIPVYVYLGSKLKESRLRWGIMGFGVLVFPSTICLAPAYLFHITFFLTFAYWPWVQLMSPVFALAIAGYIAYKKGLLKKAVA
jgi:hypothetical protein